MTVMTKPDAMHSRMTIDAPALAPVQIAKPDLISVEDAKAMDVARMTDLFKAHINPGQLHFMKLLGFDKIKIERAEGMYYTDQNGRQILDFFGGFGSWAALAPISSAAVTPGVLVVESKVKKIQHFEGGIIEDLLVKDG